MFDGKTILITGGTGSFGSTFADYIIRNFNLKKLIIFSRDEMKQWEMAERYKGNPLLRFYIGDVRDRNRLYRIFSGVDFVIHAAALKIVPIIENDPFECIKTNVLGAMNVIDAAIDNGVKRVVALSTDKASSPINLYGASKLCSDKLFCAANNSYASGHSTRFNVVRYGNVMGSRGSVIPFFLSIPKDKPIPITDVRMTRFMITLREAVLAVQTALSSHSGGNIFVKKIPSMKVTDIAEALFPGRPKEIVGIRPGEKLHEQMVSPEEASRTINSGGFYIIRPEINAASLSQQENHEQSEFADCKYVDDSFSYASNTNSSWMTHSELVDWVVANKHSYV